MSEALLTIIGILITGIFVLLCLFSFYLASKSDEYWEDVKKRLEKNNDRHIF